MKIWKSLLLSLPIKRLSVEDMGIPSLEFTNQEVNSVEDMEIPSLSLPIKRLSVEDMGIPSLEFTNQEVIS